MCDFPPFSLCFFVNKNVCIDWSIGAPGRGKYLGGGLNAFDKQHLKRYMKCINQKNEGDKYRKINPYLIYIKKIVSLADECKGHCLEGL